MRNVKFVRAIVWTTTLVALVLAQGARAEVDELVNRVPPGANCIAYINVEALVNSKLGKEEDWPENWPTRIPPDLFSVPPDAKEVLMASWFEPATLESIWEVSLIRVSKSIAMDRIAKDANGFKESLGDKMAAWSPANAYFVRLDNNLLGVVSPADRQFACHWSSVASAGSDGLSSYLKSAAKSISGRTGYLFAMDLHNAVSAKRFRRRLDMDEFECLTGKKLDALKVGEAVASIKGLTLNVSADDDLSGKCVIEFSGSVSALSSYAKPLLLECMDKAGASIADFGSWKFTVKDSSIVGSGKLSSEGLRQLVSVLEPPSPVSTDEDGDGSGSEAKAKPAVDAQAAASKRYYRAVVKILDGFGKRVQNAESLSKGASFVARDARSVGRLPLVNVDPELAKWGAGISSRMLEVASSFGVGGLNARSRAESVQDPYSTGAYSSNLEVESDPNDRINRENAARQRRAAVAEEKAKALQHATQLLLEMEASSSQIRAAMAQKYKIDF